MRCRCICVTGDCKCLWVYTNIIQIYVTEYCVLSLNNLSQLNKDWKGLISQEQPMMIYNILRTMVKWNHLRSAALSEEPFTEQLLTFYDGSRTFGKWIQFKYIEWAKATRRITGSTVQEMQQTFVRSNSIKRVSAKTHHFLLIFSLNIYVCMRHVQVSVCLFTPRKYIKLEIVSNLIKIKLENLKYASPL